MNPLALLGLGLVLGIRHATDPDHVVAVTAITARTRRLLPATGLGAIWGLGHSMTLFLVGGLILWFNLQVPPRVGLSLEFAVALALVTVGALNLRRGHGHTHDDLGDARLPVWRAFLVGTVHGLAGSAAVALLVLATVHDARLGMLYLLVFALGTLVGMALITTGLAAPLSAMAARADMPAAQWTLLGLADADGDGLRDLLVGGTGAVGGAGASRAGTVGVGTTSGGSPAAVDTSVFWSIAEIDMYSTKIFFSLPIVLLKSSTISFISVARRRLERSATRATCPVRPARCVASVT